MQVLILVFPELVVIGGSDGGYWWLLVVIGGYWWFLVAQGLGFPAKNSELKLMFKGHDFLPILRGTN